MPQSWLVKVTAAGVATPVPWSSLVPGTPAPNDQCFWRYANADLPCALPDDFRALLAATPAGGIALVEASDGTTNALSIPAPVIFAPLYGAGSARRFLSRARELGLEAVSAAIPNLADDVDTFDDLQRLQLRLGPRSQMSLATIPAVTAG